MIDIQRTATVAVIGLGDELQEIVLLERMCPAGGGAGAVGTVTGKVAREAQRQVSDLVWGGSHLWQMLLVRVTRLILGMAVRPPSALGGSKGAVRGVPLWGTVGHYRPLGPQIRCRGWRRNWEL